MYRVNVINNPRSDQPETSRMVWFGNSSRSVTCTAACMYLYHFKYYVTLCDFIIDIRYIIISRLLSYLDYYHYTITTTIIIIIIIIILLRVSLL